MTAPVYAIGDIHGHSAQLDHALALIEADGGPQAEIVFIGDYTDRGPDSPGVLDRLTAARRAGRPWTFLKGNHDRMFEYFVTRGIEHDSMIRSGKSWLNKSLGGPHTLASYGVRAGLDETADMGALVDHLGSFEADAGEMAAPDLVAEARARVPGCHLEFLAALPLTHRVDDLFFAHAGIRPGVPLDAQTEDDLVWIREPFHRDPRDHGPLIVHGHTPVVAPTHYGNRVNIDTGAGYGEPLVPVVFEGRAVWALTDGGRQAVVPAE